jgi:hypothetical protein
VGRAVAAIDARAGSPGTRSGVGAVLLGRPTSGAEVDGAISNAQVAEAVQPFWAALQAGGFIADAAAWAGTYRKRGTRWVAARGGCHRAAAAT